MRLSRGNLNTGQRVGWGLMAAVILASLVAYFLYGTDIPPLTLNVIP